jgi:hypothetical protein
MIQAGDTITESSSPIKIADLGAGVDANGQIVVFSNHATAIGPWTHVAFWYDATATAIQESVLENGLQIVPNPILRSAKIIAKRPFRDATVGIFDVHGRKVFEAKGIQGQAYDFERGDLKAGLYFIRILEGKDLLADSKVLIVD